MSQDASTRSDTHHNTLARQAQAQVDAGHYKEAIALYKKLLQHGDNDDCYRQLAYCYRQRAKSFAARGMIKEALVLWESYTEYAQPPYQDSDHYILWLIASEDQPKIEKHLSQLGKRQLDQDYPELARILGLLILTTYPEFRQLLSDDSAFSKHLNTVQAALESQDLDKMLEKLKALPYRSAFRDLRLLASACKAVSSNDVDALLDKIPARSPYAGAARLLRICLFQGTALAESMAGLNPRQRQLVAEIKGLSDAQLNLIDAYGENHGLMTDKIKFDLAIQFQSLFGEELSRRFCLTLLNRYPAGGKDYQNAFGEPDTFETHRLKALAYEQEHRHQDAEPHWRLCIKQLEHKGGDSELKIALILRHIATHQTDSALANELRIESLKHDPDDIDSLLQILRFYGQRAETDAQYQSFLADALAQFPDDNALLTLAVETAIRHKANRQAIDYANALLQIDPLNSFAKYTLLTGHLIQAREHLRSNNPELAEQEIESAAALKSGRSQALKIQLLRALRLLVTGDHAQGLEHLHEALEKIHEDPVNMHCQAAIEAGLCGLPVGLLLQALPACDQHCLTAQGLTSLIRQLTQYDAEACEQAILHQALETIKSPLTQSLSQLSDHEPLLISLCQTLENLKYFDLIQHCIDCIENYWEKPIWVYYQVYCDTLGDPSRCDHQQEHLLTSNLDKAKAEKDSRARVLIEDYLNRYHEAVVSTSLEQFQSAGPIQQLFAHVPDEMLKRIDERVEMLSQNLSPEQLVSDLEPSLAKNNKLLVGVINDPNLFTALMMLRAADELNIDLGVNIDQVLRTFEVDKPARRFFPFSFKF